MKVTELAWVEKELESGSVTRSAMNVPVMLWGVIVAKLLPLKSSNMTPI